MTNEEHIAKLDKDVSDIKQSLDTLIDLVQEMNKGLYGDPKNKHIGVIERQLEMQKEIDSLRSQIEEIEKKNSDTQISKNAKRTLRDEIVEWTQKIVGWAIQGIIFWGILKGAIGIDALI